VYSWFNFRDTSIEVMRHLFTIAQSVMGYISGFMYQILDSVTFSVCPDVFDSHPLHSGTVQLQLNSALHKVHSCPFILSEVWSPSLSLKLRDKAVFSPPAPAVDVTFRSDGSAFHLRANGRGPTVMGLKLPGLAFGFSRC